MTFVAGMVTIDVLEGAHPFVGVPTSQWHGDRLERTGQATLANLSAADGLRAQVAIVRWPDGDEVSVRMSELLGGPSDYERLEDAGEMSPKLVDGRLVARIRALKYAGGRATSAAVDWQQLDSWNGAPVRPYLTELGAAATGNYLDVLPSATRFKSEPGIAVPAEDPRALFAIYALTRVMPIMTAHGKQAVEGPHA